MAKLRLDTDTCREIIMSKIISVVIDGVLFEKSTYHVTRGNGKQSRVVQEFYLFIKRNKHRVSYICYKDSMIDFYENHMYLKDNKLHNDLGEAFYRIYNDGTLYPYSVGNYYLEGEKLEYLSWKKKCRKMKLLKLF